jgi:hypothetical protein
MRRPQLSGSNAQVAQGTIAGHQPPSGNHPNTIAGSISAADLAPGYRTSLRAKCPSGMRQIGALCFDTSPGSETPWLNATTACAGRNVRLPTVGELSLVFQSGNAQQDTQWTDALRYTGTVLLAATVSQNASRALGYRESTTETGRKYRCVVDAAQ